MRLVALTATGHLSGAERVLVEALDAAERGGWRVTCLAPRGAVVDELAARGIRHAAVPELGLAAGLGRRLRTVVSWLRAAQTLRRTGVDSDVWLVNSLSALPAVRVAALLTRRRPVTVWLAHDVLVRPDRQRLYAGCRGALDLVVAVSGAVAAALGPRADGPAVEVVHNGVASAPDPVRHRRADHPVVGINALLTPWKGHEVLLDAVELLPGDVRVELMGGALPKDAAYAEAVRDRARAWPTDRVRVLGHVPDPSETMAGWTVAVSASVEPEACPLAVLEAMSLGVPVVATDHGGAPEVLGGAGVLVPPGDAAALADAVRGLLDRPELRARLADQGRRRVATAHDRDHQVRTLLDVLTRSVEARRTEPAR